MDEGADVVYGKRIERDGETWFKNVGARGFYRLLLRMTDVPIPPDTGDFRLMTRQVVNALLSMPEQQRFIRGMVTWIGSRQLPPEYRRDRRLAGETKYSFRQTLTFAVDAIIGFSIIPLRISLYVASVFIIIAFLLMIFVVFLWLYLRTVQGDGRAYF
jgi:polyisoprenyl-phosphate glycosyltransferase